MREGEQCTDLGLFKFGLEMVSIVHFVLKRLLNVLLLSFELSLSLTEGRQLILELEANGRSWWSENERSIYVMNSAFECSDFSVVR